MTRTRGIIIALLAAATFAAGCESSHDLTGGGRASPSSPAAPSAHIDHCPAEDEVFIMEVGCRTRDDLPMGRVRDASIDFAPVCPYPEGQAWIKIEHDEIIAGCHEWKVESISGSVGGAVSG